MGRRRRKVSKNPRRGPGHNEQNKQSRESRSKQPMLNESKEAHFRYDVEQILVESGMPAEEWRPFLQTLWARGTRLGVDEAKDWLSEQKQEGAIGDDVHNDIVRLVEKTVRYR